MRSGHGRVGELVEGLGADGRQHGGELVGAGADVPFGERYAALEIGQRRAVGHGGLQAARSGRNALPLCLCPHEAGA